MKVQVVVTRSGLFGWLAGRLGLSWSHAALRYEFEHFEFENSSGAHVIEAGAFGIKELPWEKFIEGVDKYLVLQVKGGLTLAQKQAILGYAWGNVGKPYHYWWLLKIVWHLLRETLGRFNVLRYPAHVCSSLVNDCFAYADLDLVPGQGVLVLPDDLADSPLLEPTVAVYDHALSAAEIAALY
jgi:uncharacterized protein YycO